MSDLLKEVTSFKSANLEIKFKNEKFDEGCSLSDVCNLLIRRVQVLQELNPCPERHMQIFHLQEIVHWDKIHDVVRDENTETGDTA